MSDLPASRTLADRWATLSPLLDELLDLEADARAQRLAHVRQDNPALAEELSQLLAESGELQDQAFLEQGPPGLAPEVASLAGQAIGAYTLVEPLGAGGMGSVWLARRSDGRFDAQVALKLPHLSHLGPGGAERPCRPATRWCSGCARWSRPNRGRRGAAWRPMRACWPLPRRPWTTR